MPCGCLTKEAYKERIFVKAYQRKMPCLCTDVEPFPLIRDPLCTVSTLPWVLLLQEALLAAEGNTALELLEDIATAYRLWRKPA